MFLRRLRKRQHKAAPQACSRSRQSRWRPAGLDGQPRLHPRCISPKALSQREQRPPKDRRLHRRPPLRPRPGPRRQRHRPLLPHLCARHPGLREAVPRQDARAVRRQSDGAASERGRGGAVREEARCVTNGGRRGMGSEWASFGLPAMRQMFFEGRGSVSCV